MPALRRTYQSSRSEPQIPDTRVRTSASPGPIAGSGISTTATAPDGVDANGLHGGDYRSDADTSGVAMADALDREHQRHGPVGRPVPGHGERAAGRALPRSLRARVWREPAARTIARTLPAFQAGLWPMVVRTCVFDELVAARRVGEGADTVVNLASGLDARPWRMRLPATLRWIDVDLPGDPRLQAGMPRRRARGLRGRVGGGGPHGGAPRAARSSSASAGTRRSTLVLSEGLLVYLTPEQVGALAVDLHAPESFRWWAIDIVAPQLLARLNKQWAPTLAAGRAVLQFAPENGTGFFETYGWREIDYRSTFEEGIRLRRHMRGAWFYRLIGKLSGSKGREKMRRIGGIALLERT